MKKILSFIKKHKEYFIISFILIIAIIAHSYNMFHYPYYENDEGTYMAQAWSFLQHGKLAPYTYWYDHSPVGWLFISVWTTLTGGFFTFGLSINSGRILILVLHIFSVLFLYLIAKKISGSSLGASIAALLFSLSPLEISFGRRVLLDNLMVFWLLFSYVMILGNDKKLHHYFVSAVLFGIAVLTKESAIFFLPAYLLILLINSHKHHKIFATIKWLTISFSIISIYFLYALLKGEFFPSGSFFGGTAPHVSIVETYTYQLGRKGGFFLDESAGFMRNFKEWLYGGNFIPVPDPVIILCGILGTVVLLLLALRKRNLLFAAVPAIAYTLFLIRGGEVIGFYIIPLLPFFALNIGLAIAELRTFLFAKFFPKITQPLFVVIMLIPFVIIYPQISSIYVEDQTSAQIEALTWMTNNVPKNATIIMDNYGYIEFHDKSKANKFNHLPQKAEYYWKVDKDSDIKNGVLHNSWQNVDYILATYQVQYDAENAGLQLVKQAYDHSTPVANFSNGWEVSVRKVHKESNPLLATSWEEYKKNFISKEGQVTDPATERTTSEGQSYALLRAVWMNDKTTFDNVLHWTTTHMLLKDTHLFAWWYGKNAFGDSGIIDEGTATDADQDIAVALLFANKQWFDNHYLELAQKIIPAIWEYETAQVSGKRYVVAGNWTSQSGKDVYTINPSYLSPYAYRMFADVDKKHQWKTVVDSSYEVIDRCSSNSYGITKAQYLPPNWCNITRKGEIVAANNMTADATNYSFDALRVLWRIGLDYQWYHDPRARAYLNKLTFFSNEWKKNIIYAAYTHAGKPVDNSESFASYGTQLAYFTVIDNAIANDIYNKKIRSGFYAGKKNYYDQNWLWFGTAFYTKKLPNLWTESN